MEPDSHSEVLLAQIARLRGEPTVALEIVTRTLESNPENHRALLERAQIARALGDARQARQSLAQADALGGRSPEYHALGAELALESESWSEAVRHLQVLVELGQVNANVLTDLGYALANLGRSQEAAARWEEALALDPSHEAAAHNLAALREAMDL